MKHKREEHIGSGFSQYFVEHTVELERIDAPPCGRNASEQSTFVSLWSEPKGMMDPDSPAQCLQFHSEPLTGDLQPTHHHKMTTSHKTEQLFKLRENFL